MDCCNPQSGRPRRVLQAVQQFFYEPFLEAFDPELRKELGGWYTPNEVVTYMVARVDKAMREDLNIEDGLASDRVFVLDPPAAARAHSWPPC